MGTHGDPIQTNFHQFSDIFCHQGLWEHSGSNLEEQSGSNLSGSDLGAIWEQSGSHLGAIWEQSGSYLGTIWEKSGGGGQGSLWEEKCVKTIVFFCIFLRERPFRLENLRVTLTVYRAGASKLAGDRLGCTRETLPSAIENA